MFKKPFSVKSINKVISNDVNIEYPILKEFGVNCPFRFHVIDWHNRYDALIGSDDFRKLGAKIDYQTEILELDNKKIPFHLEFNTLEITPFKQKSNSKLFIPVNIVEGTVLLPELHFNDYTTPEIITKARDGICIVPINKEIEVNFNQRIEVLPITDEDFKEPPTIKMI